MTVRKVGFVGFRTGDLAALRRMFEEGLGLHPDSAREDQASYRLADGTLVEAYGPADRFHAFFTTGPVVGFEVADFDAIWSRLETIGLKRLTKVQESGGQKWVHFRLPDGTVAELIGPAPGQDARPE